MARYWKQILKPGTFWTPRGPVSFSPAQCREIYDSTRTMLSSGRSIPLPLEHQDLLPEKTQPRSEAQLAADRVRNNTGWVDGEPSILFKPEDHSIWTELDIQDDDVDRKMPIIRYVSPEIRKAFAADGRLYTNVITHIALTTQPVWKEQVPFGRPQDSLACLSTVGSLRFSLGDLLDEQDLEAIQMATGPYFAPRGGIWFRGVFYEKYVPKMILQSVEDEGEEGKKEVQDLQRKITARSSRRVSKDYAAGHEPSEAKSYEPNPQRISASYVQVDHPETGQHEGMLPASLEHKPVLVWEDPKTGLTYALEAHQRVAQAGLQGHSVVVQRLDAPTYGEAAQVAFLTHALSGRVSLNNLTHFLRHSKYSGDDVLSALKDHLPDSATAEKDVHEADHIAQLPDEHWNDWVSGKLSDAQALAIGRDHQNQEDEPAPAEPAGEAPSEEAEESQEAPLPASPEGSTAPDDPQGQGGPETPGGDLDSVEPPAPTGGIEVESVTGGPSGEFEYPPDSPMKKHEPGYHEMTVGGVRYYARRTAPFVGWDIGKITPDGISQVFERLPTQQGAVKEAKRAAEADRAENEKRRDADLAYRRKKAQSDDPPDDSAGIKPPSGEAEARKRLEETQKARAGMAGFPLTPGVKGVKKAPDFAESGLYQVVLDNGDVHHIFSDPETRNWYHDDPKDKSGLGGLVAVRKDYVLENIVKNADKYNPAKMVPEGSKTLQRKTTGVKPSFQRDPDLGNGKKVYEALLGTAIENQTSNPFKAAAHFDELNDRDVQDALAHLDKEGIYPPGKDRRGKTSLRLLATAQHFAGEHLAAREKAALEKSKRENAAAAEAANPASSSKRPRKASDVRAIKGKGSARQEPGRTIEPETASPVVKPGQPYRVPKFEVRPHWAPDHNDTSMKLGSEAHKNAWAAQAMQHAPEVFDGIGLDPSAEPTPEQGMQVHEFYRNSYPGEYDKVDLSHNGGSFFMPLDFEKNDDDKVEGKASDVEEPEEEEDEDEDEETSEGGGGGISGGKSGRLKEALRLMQKFNVHLHEDKVKTADDFVEETISVLHALEKAGLAAGGGGEPELEEETPASGAISMSANKTDTAPELDAIKARMSTLEATNAVLKNVGTTERLRNIHSTISQMVKTGRCSKAKADAWLEKLGKNRLSLLDETLPLEIVQVYAAIEEAKDNPAGTFLPAGERERLSVNGDLEDVANPTPAAPPGEQAELTSDQVAAISRELFDTGMLAGSVK